MRHPQGRRLIEAADPGDAESVGRQRLSYAAIRKSGAPNTLLVATLGLLGGRGGHALDLGAGPLNNSRLMLRAGLTVDAVDRDPNSAAIAAEMNEPRLKLFECDIRDLEVAPATYALIAAIHIFPFLPHEDVATIAPGIAGGLGAGGLLCCTFFGQRDSWARNRPRMSFHAREEIDILFAGLETMRFSEREYDGSDAKGERKHWHLYRCIFRRPASGDKAD